VSAARPLNAELWWLAIGGGCHGEIVGAIVPVIVFLPGIAIAAFAPDYVQYFWMLGFGGLVAALRARGTRESG